MPINQVLGYINQFVEHDDCRVIVVGNESEIATGDEYRKRREKLIGKRLKVQSAFDEALMHFVSLIEDKNTKSLFQRHSSEISTIYHEAELGNLRILQQTMWDFERLFRHLTKTQQRHKEAMLALLRLFFALSFEFKGGRIREEDLTSRLSQMVGKLMMRLGEEKENPSRLMLADARYKKIQLHDSILSDSLLVDTLVRGIIDQGALRASINNSRYFAKSRRQPSWRVVWHYFEISDGEFEAAHRRMEKEFAERTFAHTGEILHVFGLRLWLAEVGISNKTVPEVTSECRRYVDEIYAEKRIEPLEQNESRDLMALSGYGGLGFYANETVVFRELFDYLMTARGKAAADLYPEQARGLLVDMKADPELYFRRLSATNSPDSTYYGVPILAAADPEDFVAALLELQPANQRTVVMAFKSRYEHGGLDHDLASEKPWLEKVRDKLTEAGGKLMPIGRFRLDGYIKSYIAPFLSDAPNKA